MNTDLDLVLWTVVELVAVSSSSSLSVPQNPGTWGRRFLAREWRNSRSQWPKRRAICPWTIRSFWDRGESSLSWYLTTERDVRRPVKDHCFLERTGADEAKQTLCYFSPSTSSSGVASISADWFPKSPAHDYIQAGRSCSPLSVVISTVRAPLLRFLRLLFPASECAVALCAQYHWCINTRWLNAFSRRVSVIANCSLFRIQSAPMYSLRLS